jgi:hypothetical protein
VTPSDSARNTIMPDELPIIAWVEFNDGPMRPVYEDVDGRQFVIDDDGQWVYGVWFIPPECDEPVISYGPGFEPDF